MTIKDPSLRKQRHATYMREVWYPKNKAKHLSYVQRNKERVALYIERYKRERACADCGYQGEPHPYVLDFDHGRTSIKKFTIGSWTHSVLSINAIQKEIEKCELVCANCHRIRTFASKNNKTT
jgi:hypothetical protein